MGWILPIAAVIAGVLGLYLSSPERKKIAFVTALILVGGLASVQ